MELIALITVLGFLMYLGKLDANILRKLMHFELQVDLLVDFTLVLLFSGTLGGMMIGAMAGFMFNIALFAIKRMNGWDELRRETCESCGHGHWRWVQHEGLGWWFLVPAFLRQRIQRHLPA